MNNDQMPGKFWIDLDLRHPSWDPDFITSELGVQPWRSARHSQSSLTGKDKNAVWKAQYREGSGNNDFDASLQSFAAMCVRHEDFLKKFSEEGSITLSINQNVASDDGVLFSLHLEPALTHILSAYRISLKVQAWSTQSEVCEHGECA